MKKLLAVLLVLGMASMANAALKLDLADNVLSIVIEDGDSLVGIDAAAVISAGVGSLGDAGSMAEFTGSSVPIGAVAGSSDQSRRYSGAAIVMFGGQPIGGPATIIGGIPVMNEGEITIDLVTYAGGTDFNGAVLEAGVLDSITIPEPMTLSLLGLGGLALIRRRR